MTDLRTLALAATPGPWEERHVGDGYHVLVSGGHVAYFCHADAAYIAAANPTAVLALLDVVEAAQRAADDPDDINYTRDALRVALARLEEVTR